MMEDRHKTPTVRQDGQSGRAARGDYDRGLLWVRRIIFRLCYVKLSLLCKTLLRALQVWLCQGTQ